MNSGKITDGVHEWPHTSDSRLAAEYLVAANRTRRIWQGISAAQRCPDPIWKERSYLALDWMCRVQLPAWLDTAGTSRLIDHLVTSEQVRALPALRDEPSCKAALKTLRKARWDTVRAASAAATYTDLPPSEYRDFLHSWKIAEAITWEALDTVDAAILYPIWHASAFFARDDSWDWCLTIARDACNDAIWSVAARVTWDTVRDPDLYIALSEADHGLFTAPAKVARDNSESAARRAVWYALKPTFDQLQQTALSLVDRMLETSRDLGVAIEATAAREE